MALFNPAELAFAQTISKMSFSNPFLKQRIELEREALGQEFDNATRPFWSWSLDDEADRPNVIRLNQRVLQLIEQLRARIADGQSVTDYEFELYDDLAHYVIYYATVSDGTRRHADRDTLAANWREFSDAFDQWMVVNGRNSPSHSRKAHVYAYLCQLQDAFFNIFHCVLGRSWPIAKLRARIWQSIFTHDMRRYRRTLYDRMNEIATLVTGPSGTGKELVARAVGLSNYRTFNPKTKAFSGSGDNPFAAVNLSAFSPTLIESELFGHEKGSFTGATDRRIGYLESLDPQGSIFLDEIGELDSAIQVKLLRLLQNRQFQRIGDTTLRRFDGKIISATNRDLRAAIHDGRFREDFYYRLCSDLIQTPRLVEQLEDDPQELNFLVRQIASRVAPGDEESLSDDVIHWCQHKMPDRYCWPGNMRELEQCVRNIMIHNNYAAQPVADSDQGNAIADSINTLSLTADQLLGHYCQLAYQQTNSYEKAAAILKLDRRTVKAKIEALKRIS